MVPNFREIERLRDGLSTGGRSGPTKDFILVYTHSLTCQSANQNI